MKKKIPPLKAKPRRISLAGVAGQVKSADSAIFALRSGLIASNEEASAAVSELRDRINALEGEIHVLKNANEQMSRIMVQNAETHRKEIRAIVLQSAHVDLGPIKKRALDLQTDLDRLTLDISVIDGQAPLK